nr:hypothetical protein [Streptococcus anginosus]
SEGAQTEVCLEATGSPARAEGAGRVCADVADFAGPPVCSAERTMVDNDAGADANFARYVDE